MAQGGDCLHLLCMRASTAASAPHSDAVNLTPALALSIVQAEVSKAEAASSAASGALSGPSVGSGMLTPLIQRAKHQVEVERARAGLHCAELPQLEAAIQAARKAGVQERLQEASRYAG